ncbi:uncharacterized protein [Diadema setosum]|uniref:uncharacterized protein n=1 Tax=Diadema setosum TaxID=31175 RepID=UPI003B3BA72D
MMAGDIPLRQNLSVTSIAEFSEPISETDEIESVRQLQKLGDKAFKKKDYEKASAYYKEALEIDAENVQLLSKRAVSNIELKNYREARLDADVLVKLNPHVPQGHYLLAVCLDNLGEYAAAIAAFLRAVKHDPNHQSQLVDNVAVVAANLCQFSDDVLQKLEDAAPVDKLMLVAECLYESKQYIVCIHVQQTIQDLKQTSVEVRLKSQYLLAMCYQKHQELDRALDHFHALLVQALSHKNNIYEASAYHNLAQLNLRVGQIQQGILFYEKLLSICEDLKTEDGGEDESGEAEHVKDNLVGDKLQRHVHEILTSAYRAASDLSQALFHADQYLHTTVSGEVKNDQEVVGKAYLLVGFLREGVGDYSTALKHYQEYFAISKAKNDRVGMARAYGCLGRVYHQLHNLTLAQSYYEQELAIAEKWKYFEMVAAVLKSLSKLFDERGEHDETFKYLERYLRVSRKLDEFHTECEALMDIGDFYLHQDRLLQSEHYFEQAYGLAERTKLSEHKHKAASKLAGILVQSNEEKSLERARFLCQESIRFCEGLATIHEEEGSVFPQEMKECLRQSSAILKVSLCKLKRTIEALEHAEALNSIEFQDILAKQARNGVVERYASLDFQDMCKLVNSQSSSVLYYDVTDCGVLTWVLKPNEGCVHFALELPTKGKKCMQHLHNLIHAIYSEEGGLQNMYDCEYRALPMLDSETHQMQMYFKSLSKQFRASLKRPAKKTSNATSPATSEASENPLRVLHKILWSPIVEYVSEGEVIVVSDSILTELPFDSLIDQSGRQLGETHRVTAVPSLKVLQTLISNQTSVNDIYLTDSVDDQASLSGFSQTKSDPTKIYLDHMNRVVIPQSSRPHQPVQDSIRVAPEMAATGMTNPTVVAFDTNFCDKIPDERDPVAVMEERRIAGACARGSTLISETWSGVEVPSVKDGRLDTFRQREGKAGVIVMGNPTLPEKMRLHGKIWNSPPELAVAQMEVHKIADYLNTDPWLGASVTRDAVLSKLPRATIIHLALYGSWEEGALVCAPNPTTQPLKGGEYQEEAYQLGLQDVLGMRLCSQLVVLSCCYGNRHRPFCLSLPLAFIAAGAQCVLVMLWAVSDLVRDKFWHHFYMALQEGTMVSHAVYTAKQALRQDNRFQDARHWAAFHLIGFDQYINLMTIKHALIDHQLNETEGHILNAMKENALNVREDDPEEETEFALIRKLCGHLSAALTHHVQHPSVLPCILKLLQQGKVILGDRAQDPPPSCILPPEVLASPAAIPLLTLLGFHFQPKGPTNSEPYVVFPTWDPDGLFPPALQAVEAMTDIVVNTECSHTLAKVLEVHDKLTSGLIDLLSITKHMPEVQLRATDSGIQSMWVQNKARALLHAMGFRQIGKLIMFDGNKANRKQLFAVLQVLCAMSGEKGKNMLERLDMRYLGIAASRLATKSPRQSPVKSARIMSGSTIRMTTPPVTKVNRLRTLNPVVLPGNKMEMSTPWLMEEAHPLEVREKMKLANSLRENHIKFANRLKSNKTWHLDGVEPQADEERQKFGLPPDRPKKVKMKPNATPSMPRVPVDYVQPLSAEALEQRRDYAHFIARVRSMDLEKRHQKSVQALFLPYVGRGRGGGVQRTEAK